MKKRSRIRMRGKNCSKRREEINKTKWRRKVECKEEG
jgi:hypothetical protein